jgi:RNA polymerase sigma factor (sigma-70 family)
MGLDRARHKPFKEAMETSSGSRSKWYDSEVQVHAAELLGWLQRKFPRLSDPGNVVQESLIRVWRRLASNPGEGSPRALLFVTARNLAIDEMRRNRVVTMDAIAEMDKLPVYLSEPNAAEVAATNQELELLSLAIQSLPDRCRQVLTLRKIYGLSQKEIAARLQISEHTVEAQVANGMKRCAKFLNKYGLP